MASYLITGTSRGIGLELARALAARPASEVSVVFATYRTKTDALVELASSSGGRVVAVSMDVTSLDSIKQGLSQVEKALEGKGLDVLINNAGMATWVPDGVQAMDDLEHVFSTNVMSAHNVTRTFIPLMKKGNLKKVINVSTTVGSFAEIHKFRQQPWPSYKITKAALNMLTIQYAEQYGKEGFTIFAISPGWIKTDLGSQYADLEIEQAIPRILELVFHESKDNNGTFMDIVMPGFEPNYTRRYIPW